MQRIQFCSLFVTEGVDSVLKSRVCFAATTGGSIIVQVADSAIQFSEVPEDPGLHKDTDLSVLNWITADLLS